MPIFVLIFALFMLGTSAVVSSPVPTGKGKRAFLFIVGVALWVGAIVIVRTNQEVLKDFLLSDYAFSGALANQVAGTFVVFGLGWYVFVASSVRTERKEPTSFEQLWGNSQKPEVEIVKVFRPWPGILVWIPTIMLLTAVWIVPASFSDVDINPTATPTVTVTATNTSTATATKTPTAVPTETPEPTVTAMPTNKPTTTPTVTSEPTATATPEPTATLANTNPDMPPLACGGEWLHEKPFYIGVVAQAFERCPDGTILLHFPGNKSTPMLFEGMSIMTTVPPYRLEFTLERDGTIAVNGTPFTEWFESQGGQ